MSDVPTPEPTRGTLRLIGNPGNNTLVVNGETGWRYVDTGAAVPDEEWRAGWETVTPGPLAEQLRALAHTDGLTAHVALAADDDEFGAYHVETSLRGTADYLERAAGDE